MDRLTLSDTVSRRGGDVARLLRALANERRLQALCLLTEEEEMSVGVIAARLALSHSALSQHLGLMREDGLVARRRSGTTIYYRIADRRVGAVLALMHSLHCEGVA